MQARGRPPKSRRAPPEGAKGILKRALLRAGLTEQVTRLELLDIWEDAVGERVAARAWPHTFRRGTLIVRVISSTWQHELMFLREAIVRKLNERLGRNRVRALKLVCAAPDSHKDDIAQADAYCPDKPGIIELEDASNCGEAIADAQVRHAFVALMAQSLANKLGRNA